ncbi:12-oxophytodienoate reductase [Xenorhabdus thailandensis]|uniref:oxidoreductase n=1 Tax=Xenorhabdus thailandensis TaxID=3136255 RepID=UPI0030F3E043
MSEKNPFTWIDNGETSAPLCTDGMCTILDTPQANPLFTPFTLGKLCLRNRFALAPMGQQRSPGGVPDAAMAAYYVSRAAQGGAGLIVTESTAIDHPSVGEKFPKWPRLRRGPGEAGHAALADAVHEAGSAVFVQLWHPGSHDLGPQDSTQAISPSGHWPISGAHGRAATKRDIDELIGAYADAAALAQELGYDGVELHGAHGFLIDQFLWTVTNQRSDEYGGSPVARARFAAEVVAAVRARTGPAFPISFRVSQWKSRVHGARLVADAEELATLLAPINAAGVDLFHVSVHRYDEAAFDGSDLSLAGWVKTITGKPVMTVGAVGLDRQARPDPLFDFLPLVSRFKQGEFDLVAVGQALLHQPDWLAQQAVRFSV